MKILNLDTFATVQRTFTIKGKSHEVHEVTVQDFVDNMAAAQAIEDANNGDVPMDKGVELSVKAIRASVPTMSEIEVRQLKLSQMAALLAFIRGELDPDVVAAAQAATEAAAAPAEGEEAAEKKA